MPQHDLDAVALMAGVGFAGLAVLALLGGSVVLEARWACPLLLILIGVVGLVASRRSIKP